MSQSATPATQNNMTTCLETFEKERFCSFPHRHGEATGKPETRQDTYEHQNQHFVRDFLQFSKFETCRKDKFCSFPHIDTATPPENQRLETRRVGTPKRAFPARLLPIFTLCSFKVDVFLRIFLGTSKFCYLKIDVSCEASVNFQHMSQNATLATEFAPCRHLTQPCHCDLQKTRNATRLKCCACHEKCDGHVQSAAPATKTATHLLKTSQKDCAWTFGTLCRTRLNVTKCHACHAKRSNDTLETSKNDHLCRTSHRHGHTEFVRTVADGCGRLRTVADGCDHKRNVERTHPQPPDPQSETGTLATHSGNIGNK